MKTRIIALILAALLVLSTAHAATLQPTVAAEILSQTNAERAKYSLPPLAYSAELSAAAQTRALEIIQKFSHIRPNGQTGSSVSPLAFNENIARGHRTADKTMAAWLTSPSHRRSILSQAYTSIGVAAVRHNNILYCVQLFGR